FHLDCLKDYSGFVSQNTARFGIVDNGLMKFYFLSTLPNKQKRANSKVCPFHFYQKCRFKLKSCCKKQLQQFIEIK
ncbi:MAG: hypothetical protein ACPGXL_05035, partial [Chitinophagales bacterium]